PSLSRVCINPSDVSSNERVASRNPLSSLASHLLERMDSSSFATTVGIYASIPMTESGMPLFSFPR
ncbi:MAG: hypothetical protein AAFO89_03915, partial [Planctomycetota bacterium]